MVSVPYSAILQPGRLCSGHRLGFGAISWERAATVMVMVMVTVTVTATATAWLNLPWEACRHVVDQDANLRYYLDTLVKLKTQVDNYTISIIIHSELPCTDCSPTRKRSAVHNLRLVKRASRGFLNRLERCLPEVVPDNLWRSLQLPSREYTI